jgi:hypothetical protein
MTGGVVRINTLQAVGRWRSWHFRPSPWGPLSSARTASAWRLGRPPMTPAKHTPPRRWWPTPKSVVIAADGSKIGIVTFARMAGLADIHDLVTDITAPPPPPPTSTNTSPPDPPHTIRSHLLRLGQEKQDQHRRAHRSPASQNHPGAHPRAAPGMVGRTSHRRRVVVALPCRRHRAAALRTTVDQNRGVEDHGDRAQPT